MKFLVNGSIAFDLLLSSDSSFLSGIDPKNLEHLSVNYLAQGFKRHHGGTASNISWNLALLGHMPSVISTVGFDGTEYVELLRERGVDISRVEHIKSAITATAIIATDSAERQISFFHPGADAFGTFPSLKDEREEFSYAIMSPRNPVVMMQGAMECEKQNIPYLFDPGQVVHAFGTDEFRRAVSGSVGLITNEYEWGIASQKLEWKEEDIVKACGMLVITLGDKGLRIITQDEDFLVPACKTDHFVNPTGAGDAVRAGLLHGLSSGWSMTDTGRLSAVLGCLVVEQEGTLLESLDMDEVQGRAKETYGEGLPLR